MRQVHVGPDKAKTILIMSVFKSTGFIEIRLFGFITLGGWGLLTSAFVLLSLKKQGHSKTLQAHCLASPPSPRLVGQDALKTL